MADVNENEYGDFQMAQPPVVVAIGKYAKSSGVMTTSGLANCMAVVAYHPDSDEAVLWHLNTLGVFEADLETDAYDADGEPTQAWHLSQSALEGAKKQVDVWLGHASGSRYAIALGTQWRSEVAKSERKAELVDGIRKVFDPVQMLTDGQDLATWDPLTQKLT